MPSRDNLRFRRRAGSPAGRPTMIDPSQSASPARLFLLVVGTALVLGGIAGFFYESDFGTGAELVADDVLGIFPTNGWDNVLHLIAGLACLAAAPRAPRPAALALGALFSLLAVWGALATDRGIGDVLDVIPVDADDNLLHLAIGLCGLAAGAATGRRTPSREPAPERGRNRRATGERRDRERGTPA